MFGKKNPCTFFFFDLNFLVFAVTISSIEDFNLELKLFLLSYL